MSIGLSFDLCSAAEYYDAVADGKDHEAVYYLLKHRLDKALYRTYELHGFGLNEEYEDTIDEFFLYLHEGNQAQDQRPFAVFERVRDKKAFFAWVLGVYRWFLTNRAREESKRRKLMEEVLAISSEEERHRDDETMMRFMATAIAYADQELIPRNLFIFYRMVLTILNHRMAIPQDDIAKAMGILPVTYRVYSMRMKERLSDYILLMEKGGVLQLDEEHQRMSERVVRDFDRLYELLMEYYDNTIQRLPDSKEIQTLRLDYGRDEGMVMHEELEYGFGHAMDVAGLYCAFRGI